MAALAMTADGIGKVIIESSAIPPPNSPPFRKYDTVASQSFDSKYDLLWRRRIPLLTCWIVKRWWIERKLLDYCNCVLDFQHSHLRGLAKERSRLLYLKSTADNSDRVTRRAILLRRFRIKSTLNI